jgi:predicted GIY-YIG superfamily endonuclease
MFYVYRIRSRNQPRESFIGTTRSVKKRLALHNSGQVSATREYCPWVISFYAAFTRKQRAHDFEDYLKSPEGKQFGRKHLWNKFSDPDQP